MPYPVYKSVGCEFFGGDPFTRVDDQYALFEKRIDEDELTN